MHRLVDNENERRAITVDLVPTLIAFVEDVLIQPTAVNRGSVERRDEFHSTPLVKNRRRPSLDED
jgi:hypothetical protein